MKALDPSYSADVDTINKSTWHEHLSAFGDATFYQTWSYGAKLWGEDNLSHLVLTHEGRIVSMAQARILRLPLLKTGVAYINWGPLWRTHNMEQSRVHLRNMLRALYLEYVGKRKLVIRILPKIPLFDDVISLREIFREEGFSFTADPLHTFIVDLRLPLEELKHNLSTSWKRSLKFAEKQGLDIVELKDPKQYEFLYAVYSQMKERKRYIGSDQRELLEINDALPNELRLKVLGCKHQQETIAVLGWSNVGKMAIPIVGFTGDQALQFKASFLLWWEMIQHCKKAGFEKCDLAAVNPKRNPGGHFFKKGLAGKEAQETTYIGQFDAYDNPVFYIFFSQMVVLREKIKKAIIKLNAASAQ
jgi:lipid II:glycine glycyltransferase (peptidoglycan interpeptide bridge formation enzyme)